MEHVQIVGFEGFKRIVHQLVHASLDLGLPFFASSMLFQYQMSYIGGLKLIVLPIEVFEVIARLKHAPLFDHLQGPLLQVAFLSDETIDDPVYQLPHELVVETYFRREKHLIAIS